MAKKRTLIETLEIKNYGLAEDIEAFLVSAGYDIDVEAKDEMVSRTCLGNEFISERKDIIRVYKVDERSRIEKQ